MPEKSSHLGHRLRLRRGGALSPQSMLHELHARGAVRLEAVRFRDNRSTFWSLTRDYRVLNLHTAYRRAPHRVLDAFAIIARRAGRRSESYDQATCEVRDWPPVHRALEEIRRQHRAHEVRRMRAGYVPRRAPCCATPAQLRYLRRLYDYLNETRFDGTLADDIRLRLSSRMRQQLGEMNVIGARRKEFEIALNVDLMREENDEARIDIMVHEMAHLADYLMHGKTSHGPEWRSIAEAAGCVPRALSSAQVRIRRRGSPWTERVPPLARRDLQLAFWS